MRAAALACGLVALGSAATRAQHSTDADLETTLERAAARVERYFTRAQSLMCTETVHVQPLGWGLSPEGPGRTVESELRLSWDPASEAGGTEAETRRVVVRVNGRPPRKNDRNSCTTPEQSSTETQPLSMLLREQRGEYAFALAGMGKVDRRPAIQVDYRLLAGATVDVKMVEGRDDCISYDIEGGLRGRLWIDAETYDVLRLDQRLAGLVEVPLPREVARRPGAERFWTLERWDTTMRFRRLGFSDPEETFVVPVSTSELRVTRGAGTPRLRTTTEYTSYKRFLTGGRIIGDAP